MHSIKWTPIAIIHYNSEYLYNLQLTIFTIATSYYCIWHYLDNLINSYAKMSIGCRVESGSHLLTLWAMQMWHTYDPCTCDLHSEVANAKCNAAKWYRKHSDWNDFCFTRFLHSCKVTEIDYSYGPAEFLTIKTLTSHSSKQLELFLHQWWFSACFTFVWSKLKFHEHSLSYVPDTNIIF